MVIEALQTKMFDPDEKVRAATCKVYSHLDYETALHHVSKGTLQVVVGRGLDKKVVRPIYYPLKRTKADHPNYVA